MEGLQSKINIGSTIAERYKLERLLGDGGMGKVYLATDLMLEGERVALKILRANLLSDEKSTRRFLREVRLTRKINHPNVVRTFDIAKEEELLFFTMEYVEGITLRTRLENGAVDANEATWILLEIAKGLSAIHEGQIIHRDLKPANIIITSEHTAKIADFGVAKRAFSSITAHNEILGSAGYMAPEVWTGGSIDVSTDIYSLGAMVYEMLTGLLPFDGETPEEVMNRHLKFRPPPIIHIPGVPEWLGNLVLRMLEKEPGNRPKNIREVIDIIEASQKNDTKKRVRSRVNTGDGDIIIAPKATSLSVPLGENGSPGHSAETSDLVLSKINSFLHLPPTGISKQKKHHSVESPTITGGYIMTRSNQSFGSDKVTEADPRIWPSLVLWALVLLLIVWPFSEYMKWLYSYWNDSSHLFSRSLATVVSISGLVTLLTLPSLFFASLARSRLSKTAIFEIMFFVILCSFCFVLIFNYWDIPEKARALSFGENLFSAVETTIQMFVKVALLAPYHAIDDALLRNNMLVHSMVYYLIIGLYLSFLFSFLLRMHIASEDIILNCYKGGFVVLIIGIFFVAEELARKLGYGETLLYQTPVMFCFFTTYITQLALFCGWINWTVVIVVALIVSRRAR